MAARAFHWRRHPSHLRWFGPRADSRAGDSLLCNGGSASGQRIELDRPDARPRGNLVATPIEPASAPLNFAVETFRLAHVSDPHFGAHHEALVEALPDALQSLHLDATMVTGDFTMAGRKHEFRAAREWLDRIPGPLLVIPGNHDIPKFNQPFDRIFRPFRRYRGFIDPEIEDGLRNKGMHLAALNSSRPFGWYLDWSRGRISHDQLRWIEREFADSRPDEFRVLALHHPTVAPPENTRDLIGRVRNLKATLAKSRIDLVLGGHFHQSYLMSLDCESEPGWRTVVSQVSTATSTRLQGEPNGFHVLECSLGFLGAGKFVWNGLAFVEEERFAFRRDPESGWTALTDEERP